MTTYNVGDIAKLTLDVTPSDATTAVAVEVTAPDGTTFVPAVTGGPATWNATQPLDQAGVWVATWTVTGTGSGVEQHRIAVAPNGPVATGHATTADLAGWLQAAPPANADRLLARASAHVDRYVLSGYVVDGAGLPTDPDVVAALRDATCAQVEQWLSVGEDNDYDGYDHHTNVSAGGTGVSHRPSRLAPRARDILRDAGLLWTRAW